MSIKVPEGWEVRKLGEITEIIGGGTPSTKKPEYWDGDISWITPKDLSNFPYRYIYRGSKNITELGLKKSSAKLLPRGTVLLSSRAPIGYVAIAGKELATNQGFRSFVIKEKNKLNNEFLYYWLKLNKPKLESIASGSTFKEVSGSALKQLKIILPPLSEQEKIADILGSIDDQIENLTEQNKTLEEIAKTIFKRWFIDFEFPNEEGKPYKSSGGEFIDSELGKIPKGWRVGKLGELINISSGKGLKKDEFTKNGLYPVFGANGIIGKTNKYLLDEKIIFTGRVGTLGKVFLYEGKAWFSDNTLVITPKEKEYFHFIFQFLKKQKLENLNIGSTQPLIRQKDIKNLKMVIPDKELIKHFYKMADNLHNQIRNNQHQIQTLTQLRDILLPKLITGQIRVKV